VKKILSALLMLLAVFLAFASAASTLSAPDGADAGFTAKLKLPFTKFQGPGVVVLVLAVLALAGALYLLFSKSRAEKAASMPSAKVAAKYAMIGRKSKGLEVGFLFSGLLALAVLAMIIFSTVKLGFDKATLGALGAVFVLQIIMGLLFLILFLKKKDKAVVPFIPALALFLFEVAIGAFGLVRGLQ
jgi:hypothetical protein